MPVIHEPDSDLPHHELSQTNQILRRDEDAESNDGDVCVAETVYVALGRDVRDNKKTLQWTIRTLKGANIVILHVHQSVRMVRRPFWGKMYSCSLKSDVQEYRLIEWQETVKVITEYLSICAHEKVKATHLILESECGVQKGLVEGIAQHAIKKLVIGAASDKKYSEKMKAPTSQKAIYVNKYADPSCQIWYICEGNRIYTRQPFSNQRETLFMCLPPAVGATPNREHPLIMSPGCWSSSLVSFFSTGNPVGPSATADSLQLTAAAEHEPTHTEATGELPQDHSKMEEMPAEQLRIAFEEMHEVRREVFLESYRRFQAEEEAFQARESAKIAETSLAQAERGRKQAECLLLNAREEQNKLLRQHQTTILEMQKISADKSSLDAQVSQLRAELAAEHKQREEAEASHSEKRLELEDLMHENQETKEKLEAVTTNRSLLERKTTTLNKILLRMAKILLNEQNSLKKIIEERDDVEKQKDDAVRLKFVVEGQRDEALREKAEIEKQRDEALREKAEIEKQRDDALREKFKMQRQRDNALRQVKKLLHTEARPGGNVHKFAECSHLELVKATKNFSPSMQVAEGGFARVFKGRLNHTAVAIKMLKPEKMQSVSSFRQDVDILSCIKHPYLRTLLGASTFQPALIYEYLQNGTLEDWIHSKNQSSGLPWYARTRIAVQICSALLFLHSLGVVHGNLEPSNIFLDDNLHVKISSFGINRIWEDPDPETSPYKDPEFNAGIVLNPASDMYSLGIIILQLLTGKHARCIAVEVQKFVPSENLHTIIDPTAGDWPILQAVELAKIGLKCCSASRESQPDLRSDVWEVLEPLSSALLEVESSRPVLDIREPPSYFICPISQDIMRDPRVAADGFTYEGEAISTWLDSGHMTSPMTNLRLSHSHLVPNHALRSAIQEWLKKS